MIIRHLIIEYTPALVYLILVYVLQKLDLTVLGCTLVFAWKYCCMEILNQIGLVQPLFNGMELITGFERGLLIGQEVQPIVTTVLRV